MRKTMKLPIGTPGVRTRTIKGDDGEPLYEVAPINLRILEALALHELREMLTERDLFN